MAENEQNAEVANTKAKKQAKGWSSPALMGLTRDETGASRVDIRLSKNLEIATRKNPHLARSLARDISGIASPFEEYDDISSNFALSLVDSMEPKDPIEALLLTQMAATHLAAMMMARKLNNVETIQQQDSAERALNKLLRTFTTQMEALKRYRSKGQQVARVERVTVEDGGQAIVGNVQHGGGMDDKS